LIQQPEYLQAYARYFIQFVQAYRREGITIQQLHVQNEPEADQKFPSCRWTGAQLRDFIRDYLGPMLAESGESSEIWLGTLNSNDYESFANTVLSDASAANYIAGVGYQWAGKDAVQRTAMSWPAVRLMQTENECGDGKNSWEYARYVFGLIWHYLTNGVNAYVYWNMVLAPGGTSTWGWTQNAMISADPLTGEVRFNPEFYVMKHFAHFIDPGAVRLAVTGAWAGSAVAFKNPDKRIVTVVANQLPTARPMTLTCEGKCTTMMLSEYSINTFVISPC
jgi:glucosylceramidase